MRNGPLPTGAGLTNCCSGAWKTTPCFVATNCADMRGHTGSDDTEDFANWIGWQWQGTLSTTTDHGAANMTYYPANQGTNWGRNGGTRRLGDWAEIDYSGDNGNNIAGPINATISINGSPGPLSGPPLNYGKAITRTLYVWGDPAVNPANPTNYSSNMSSQIFKTCTVLTCTTAYVWEDVTISGPNTNGTYDSSDNVNRVRITRSYDAILYENIQSSSNEAKAVILDRPAPGPVPGGGPCSSGWTPGGGVYGRQVNP
jgi:hypothetical protein